MKKHFFLVLMLSVVGLTLTACGAPKAPSFNGTNWRPIHKYSDSVQKIPLHARHVYSAQAADETLRGLLQRWASESGARLVYAANHDFSLPKEVASIHTTSLSRAVSKLHNVYRTHGVEVYLDVVNNSLYVKEKKPRKRKK